ncbi:hypothetical protein [Actinotalea fermentans]|uniref:Gram-positive cocci surface proteins LPxTG domain-containing protein n=1 Tax=Actinotalea fermentans TaxID=43671 RepID=A0A511Z1H7_9CELL|nr:hypothetical protein [Actinotalea fermentans]KGM17070.1 hypothetical protein N867_10585 [Actinotalea fermentans ATCC 43279 = JCM 9966 = DSM 3133]GEN81293.1 hypothetical protein AFE02nite_30270 [Actinotalea fermentans]
MNLRRTLLTSVGTLTLVALPAVAMAYDAPGYDTTVNDSTPAVGQAITINTLGQTPNEQLTLTITSNPATIGNDQIQVAGTKSLAKTANASGDASWSVTLNAAGTYTARVTNAAGALVGDEVLTVAAAPGSSLSDTGFDGMELALGAGALILAGGAAVVVARRRQAVRA